MLLNNRFGSSRIGDAICLSHNRIGYLEGDHREVDQRIKAHFLRMVVPLLGSRVDFGRAHLELEFTITWENVNHD